MDFGFAACPAKFSMAPEESTLTYRPRTSHSLVFLGRRIIFENTLTLNFGFHVLRHQVSKDTVGLEYTPIPMQLQIFLPGVKNS